MKPLSDLSIKQKLTLVIMATTLSGLLATGITFAIYEWKVFRQDLVQTLSSLAEVTASNSTAALTFKDQKRAEENVDALRSEPHIVLGCIYLKEGPLFAVYHRPDRNGPVNLEKCPDVSPADGREFEQGYLTLTSGIYLDRERIGSIVIRSDLSGLRRRDLMFLGMLLILVLVIGFFSYLLSLNFRRLISAPILGLADIAKRVSVQEDYSLRARKQSSDEVGFLVDSFNEMLFQIEKREKHLAHTNEELRKSEEQFRADFELTATGKAQAEPETGRFIRVNPKFCEMTGYSKQELLKMTYKDLTHPEDIESDIEIYQKMLNGRTPIYDRIKRYKRKNGETIWVHVFASIIRSLKGRPLITTGVILDITRQKHAEEERDRLLIREKQARSDAEEALRSREEFMSLAGHELRTPLTPLKLQIQIVKNIITKEISPETKGRRELIMLFTSSEQQIDRLTKLVEDLLDISRINLGRLKLNSEQIDLADLVTQVLQRYETQFKQAACSVQFHGEKGIIGQWDRLRIEQAVINLLMNALKYGSGKPIEIRVTTEGNQAKVQVRDFGIGIAEEDQKRIFGRFERAVSVRHFGGFGLGLFISRQIVQAHGGDIDVESKLGVGSTFTLWLPLPHANTLSKAA